MSFFKFKKDLSKQNKDEQEIVFKPLRIMTASSSDAFLACETLVRQLQKNNSFDVLAEPEIINETFLNFDNKNFFDFLDAGSKILKKHEADILIWIYHDKNKVRLNFQTLGMYKKFKPPFFSLLDPLYLPVSYFNQNLFPKQILTLIFAILTAPFVFENKAYEKQMKQTLNILSKEKFPEGTEAFFKPYILKGLITVYLTSNINRLQKKDLTALLNLISICIKDCQKEYDGLLSGSLYALLGQIYHAAYHADLSEPYLLIKKSIESYKTAQKYFNRYVFPYDFARLSFVLSDLYFRFFNITDDQQALRDAIFHLRQAEKIFTISSMPFLFAEIEGILGQYLSILSNVSDNEEIALLAIQNLKNKQKVYDKKFNPSLWCDVEIEIGNIYYYLGKRLHYEKYLEESITHYSAAFDISLELNQTDCCKKIEGYMNKAEEEIMKLAEGI